MAAVLANALLTTTIYLLRLPKLCKSKLRLNLLDMQKGFSRALMCAYWFVCTIIINNNIMINTGTSIYCKCVEELLI